MEKAISKISYEKLTAIIYLLALFVDLSDQTSSIWNTFRCLGNAIGVGFSGMTLNLYSTLTHNNFSFAMSNNYLTGIVSFLYLKETNK